MTGLNVLTICKAELLRVLSMSYSTLGTATNVEAKGYSDDKTFEITFESHEHEREKKGSTDERTDSGRSTVQLQ